MKKTHLFTLSFLYFFFAFALNASAQLNTNEDTTTYFNSNVEKKAEFPGGMEAFYNYIGENFEIPTSQEFKGGKIIASFVIEKDGSVNDIKVLREIGFGTTDEAIRVLKACPLWNPAEHDGKKVRVQYNLPINLQPNPLVDEVVNNKVYDITEVQIKPQYGGESNKFYNFIKTNYTPPNVPGLKGKIYVRFTIDTDGSLIDIKVLRDIGYGTGSEAIRVLKLSPKWTPAIKDGHPVQCTYNLPISIEIPVESTSEQRHLHRSR